VAIWVGTSGYQYAEWRGSFYPHDLDAAAMLPYYAERFRTVESNYSFRQMPTAAAIAGWAAATPADFRLSLRAPRRITHLHRLNQAGVTATGELLSRAELLRDKLGAILFQIAPEHNVDVPLLAQFLAQLPAGTRTAWEFRNPDWLTDQVFDCLREHRAALCVSDSETIRTPALRTADFGYFRLRDEGYAQADLERWAAILQEWDASAPEDMYVYFRHESEAKGPDFARRLVDLLGLH
jgi:uncharacterized protein YecE (DUF72 family)